MNGFGFLEYDDPMDAKDVVPGKQVSSCLLIFANRLQLFVWILGTLSRDRLA
jgi:hypothetical protein